jgi:hypothetical protein
MSTAGLPADGELRLGSVTLPAGRRRALTWPTGVRADNSIRPASPVAWLTDTPVPDPGRVWAALSAASARTGLVPFLAASLRGEGRRPWDSGEFCDPEDVARIDQLDPASILRQGWDERTHEVGVAEADEAEEDRQSFEAEVAPFSRQFPGLAPASAEPPDPGRRQDALNALRPSRIGLAVAGRPGDVLPAMGWIPANWTDGALPVAAILRSWEDRFGARLLEVGFADFKLLVDRPPRTLQAAQRIAAEQFAFADECACAGQVGLTEVGTIAPCLVSAPVWGFWWD